MAANRVHEGASEVAAILIAAGAVAFRLRWDLVLALGYSVLLGGYFLSPDLDTKNSIPYRRWRWMRFWWKPYQMLFNHRSFFSHGPVVGTLIRVVWLFPFWLPIVWYFHPDWFLILALVGGLEIMAMTHLILDLGPN